MRQQCIIWNTFLYLLPAINDTKTTNTKLSTSTNICTCRNDHPLSLFALDDHTNKQTCRVTITAMVEISFNSLISTICVYDTLNWRSTADNNINQHKLLISCSICYASLCGFTCSHYIEVYGNYMFKCNTLSSSAFIFCQLFQTLLRCGMQAEDFMFMSHHWSLDSCDHDPVDDRNCDELCVVWSQNFFRVYDETAGTAWKHEEVVDTTIQYFFPWFCCTPGSYSRSLW